MESNFQSSFIPRGRATGEALKKKKPNFLGGFIVFLFILSIIAAGGLYFYKGIVEKDIQDLQSQIAEAEKNIDKKTINELVQFSKKLEVAQSIVLKHEVVSNFLEALASSTVSAVYFTDFNYGNLGPEGLTVNLTGNSTSYAAIALQENLFSKNKYFRSLTFSDMRLTDKGLISFELAISIDPQISVYTP